MLTSASRRPGLPMMNRVASYPDLRQAIPWRDWEAGRTEALERGIPIVAVADWPWTNSAQRLAYILGNVDVLRSAMSDRVVPVLVDPDRHPALVAGWRWIAMELTGSAGPPLIVLLTDGGKPFLSYGSLRFEGDDEYPSLASVIISAADAWAEDRGAFDREAAALANGVADRSVAGGRDQSAPGEWDTLRATLDLVDGGLREIPKHPRPALLWALLDRLEAGGLPDDVAEWLVLSLRAMDRGGIHDQLDRGFHRCSRDARWVVPHFEKPVPLNAQLAAVYARASRCFPADADRFAAIAVELDGFCRDALRDGIDALASDSPYYTWTAAEFLKALSPVNMQPLALRFNIVPGEARQVLYAANTVATIAERFSRERPASLGARIDHGRAELLAARRRRDAPAAISLDRPEWRATTIGWVLRASEYLSGSDPTAPLAALCDLVDSPADGCWSGDHAALFAATVTAARLDPDGDWLAAAAALASALDTLDIPISATIDDTVPAPVAVIDAARADLARLTGE